MAKNHIKKGNRYGIKSIFADGIEYLSINKAAKALGVKPKTIRRRILENESGYYYIDKKENKSMALSIDSTNKGASANSYITAVEADEYFEKIPYFSSTWSALDSTTQIQLIIHAAMAIDRLDFSGRRYTTTQALEFPRDNTDYITNLGIMPQRVKDAQCEMIIFLYNYVDSDSGKIQEVVSEMTIDSSFSVKFRDKNYSSNDTVVGGTINTVMNLLSIWTGGQVTAHLRRA